jgi:S1-C subfamily serine protease
MNWRPIAPTALVVGLLTAVPQPSLARKPHYFGEIAETTASSGSGVRLLGVKPGSPAEKAGLQTGDIIVKLGNVPVLNLHDLNRALQTARPDKPVEVIYMRQGQEQRTEAELVPRRQGR